MQTIAIDPVTRIEGHARVILELADNGTVEFSGLVVNELRGFERILVGMEADRLPLVTGRVCGVCPSAHHLASAKALDAAVGVDPPPAAKLLRELLYMGHYIHSHTLSLFVLSGPDLVFGFDGDPARRNIVGVVEAVPDVAKKALRLRTLGQKINELVGGRGIHPVTAVAGGITFELTAERHKTLTEWTDEALGLGVELAGVAKSLLGKLLEKHPALLEKLVLPSWYMGTVRDGKLNVYDGKLRVVDETGKTRLEFAAGDYDKHLVERTFDWSYMKPVYMNADGEEHLFRVNTLARANVADAMETPLAQQEFETFHKSFGKPVHQTVLFEYARVIELIYACEKAKQLLGDSAIRGETRAPVAKFPGGRGVGHVEAPRGTLFHDYEIDDKGIVRSANLIVATQQNYAAINKTIAQAAESFVVGRGDGALLDAVEFAIRCHDPCLSCATHALGRMPLEVVVTRNGREVRRARREDR